MCIKTQQKRSKVCVAFMTFGVNDFFLTLFDSVGNEDIDRKKKESKKLKNKKKKESIALSCCPGSISAEVRAGMFSYVSLWRRR